MAKRQHVGINWQTLVQELQQLEQGGFPLSTFLQAVLDLFKQNAGKQTANLKAGCCPQELYDGLTAENDRVVKAAAESACAAVCSQKCLDQCCQ